MNNRLLLYLVTLLSLALTAPRVAAQGTVFTYQGRLNDNGVPANGNYGMIFYLCDAPATGGQLANLGIANVPVSNGLFTVALDFGNLFDGNGRWLEIAVQTNGAGSFTTLSPRQSLTATPYAITASNLSGTLPATQISGIISNTSLPNNPSFAGTVAATAFAGDGAGVTNINAATLGGLSSGNFWKTTGNAGTTAGTHFLGTTDNQPLELKVNNTRALRIEPNTNDAPNIIAGSPLNDILSLGLQATVGATISGGQSNRVRQSYGTISGGATNYVGSVGSVISGGVYNQALAGRNSVIGGGTSNVLDVFYVGEATIGGGKGNKVLDWSDVATIGGGSGNVISRVNAGTIAGGFQNSIFSEAEVSTIGGGIGNRIQGHGLSGTISGGSDNTIGDYAMYSTIGGGGRNVIGWTNYILGIDHILWGSTISGGRSNTIQLLSDYSTISGGQMNLISTNTAFGTISGGHENVLQTNSLNGTIGGGHLNQINGPNSTIAGGERNSTKVGGSSIGGGTFNTIFAPNWYDSVSFDNTIAGGSSNSISHISSDQARNGASSIGGGVRNAINDNSRGSTIGGGIFNTLYYDSPYATIGGGRSNSIDGWSATIAGGSYNDILQESAGAAIGGGEKNTIYGSGNATIGGGFNNTIQGIGSGGSIGGGAYNYIRDVGFGMGGSGWSGKTIGGGYSNRIEGAYAGIGSTISGGMSNLVADGGMHAFIPGGLQAKAFNYGQMTHASGQFASVGDAQTSEYVCRVVTTNSAPQNLFLDGASKLIKVPTNSTWALDILVTARAANGSSAVYQIRGSVRNNAGVTALFGVPIVTIVGEDVPSWDVTLSANDADDSLVLTAFGDPTQTVRWVATVHSVEVSF